ncbi:MAG: hypothetical protein Fur0010_02940 [Bdellovibrio sp.]
MPVAINNSTTILVDRVFNLLKKICKLMLFNCNSEARQGGGPNEGAKIEVFKNYAAGSRNGSSNAKSRS